MSHLHLKWTFVARAYEGLQGSTRGANGSQMSEENSEENHYFTVFSTSEENSEEKSQRSEIIFPTHEKKLEKHEVIPVRIEQRIFTTVANIVTLGQQRST